MRAHVGRKPTRDETPSVFLGLDEVLMNDLHDAPIGGTL
jgi:hypothetical protein